MSIHKYYKVTDDGKLIESIIMPTGMDKILHNILSILEIKNKKQRLLDFKTETELSYNTM